MNKEFAISDHEIIVMNDGDGIAVIGEPKVVELFLVAEGVSARDMELPKLGSAIATGSGAAQVASEVASRSGRWIQLTEKSAMELAKGTPMKGSEPGLSRAILTENGRTKSILEFAKTPGSMASNPAILAGAAGLMAQLAMQQTMSEITDYLATIDAKLDDVLRGQKDSVVADMIGVGMVIDEALTIREGVGGVSEVTWSKVQSTVLTIARTQAYALAQIDDLTGKLARERRVNHIADVAGDLDSKIHEWLAILARCFQLQDATSVLELDRVLAATPAELDAHRRALRLARQHRRDRIAGVTQGLLARLDEAATTANAKVLFNPVDSRKVLAASSRVTRQVGEFHTSLDIVADRESVLARPWREAVTDVKDRVVDSGARGAGRAKRLGSDAASRVKSTTGRSSRAIADRVRRSDAERNNGLFGTDRGEDE